MHAVGSTTPGTSVASMARDRLGAVTLAAAYTMLAACHGAGTAVPGRALPAALLVAQDLLLAALLLARPSASAVSRQWSDRLVAAAAQLVPLGLHAPAAAVASVSAVLEVAGLLLAMLATATLGRQLGVLPAVRGLTTRGVYAVVRHPMYAAYMLLFIAYVAGKPSAYNLTFAVAACALLVVRLRTEEAMLGRHVDYQAYCQRVPWRLVPGCY
jgi:protein-S-isoprenylcysteine O-methyltransferase Ste14